MSSLAELYDRIERYLRGAMSPRELDEFNQKMTSDSQLASSVKLHREISETLAGEKIHDFRKTLQTVDAGWKPATGGNWLRVLKNPQKLAIAASLLLLIGFFGWLAFPSPSNPELASANFEQLPLQALMSLDSSEAHKLRTEAHQAYIAGTYKEAAEKFRELSLLMPRELSYQLYLGVSQLGEQRAAEAVQTLQPLAESDNRTVKQEATWYLALAYLQLDQAEAAIPYLERLVTAGTYRPQQAGKLLRAID